MSYTPERYVQYPGTGNLADEPVHYFVKLEVSATAYTAKAIGEDLEAYFETCDGLEFLGVTVTDEEEEL